MLSSTPLILLDSVSPVPLLLLVESSPPAPKTQSSTEKSPSITSKRGNPVNQPWQLAQPPPVSREVPSCPRRAEELTPVRAAVQVIIQHGATQGSKAPAAPQVGLAHHGLTIVGGLGAGGGREALCATRFPPDRPAGGENRFIRHVWWRVTLHAWGGMGNSPQSLDQHHFPPHRMAAAFGGCKLCFAEASRPSRASLPLAPLRFSGRHLQRTSLPPPSRHPAAAGSWHPATHGRLPCRALETQRCLGRERGLWLEQGHSQCQGGHAGMRQAHRRVPFCKLAPYLTQEGPWCGMERPAPVRSGQREPPHSCPPLTCRWSP